MLGLSCGLTIWAQAQKLAENEQSAAAKYHGE
jgi:hypothetical protein